MYYLADIDSLEQEDNNLQLNDYYIFNEAFTEEECLKIITIKSTGLMPPEKPLKISLALSKIKTGTGIVKIIG